MDRGRERAANLTAGIMADAARRPKPQGRPSQVPTRPGNAKTPGVHARKTRRQRQTQVQRRKESRLSLGARPPCWDRNAIRRQVRQNILRLTMERMAQDPIQAPKATTARAMAVPPTGTPQGILAGAIGMPTSPGQVELEHVQLAAGGIDGLNGNFSETTPLVSPADVEVVHSWNAVGGMVVDVDAEVLDLAQDLDEPMDGLDEEGGQWDSDATAASPRGIPGLDKISSSLKQYKNDKVSSVKDKVSSVKGKLTGKASGGKGSSAGGAAKAATGKATSKAKAAVAKGKKKVAELKAKVLKFQENNRKKAAEAKEMYQKFKATCAEGNGAQCLFDMAAQKNAKIAQLRAMVETIKATIRTVHGISHPLFDDIFIMTWTPDRMYIPGPSACRSVAAAWSLEMEAQATKYGLIDLEIGECWEFITKLTGNVLSAVEYYYNEAYNQLLKEAKKRQQLWEQVKAKSILSGCSLSLNLPDFSWPNPWSLPNGSLSIQMENLERRLRAFCEMVKQKAKECLEKLKDMECPDLYQFLPYEFFLLFSILEEVLFIYNNLPTALNRMLNHYLLLGCKKFAELADDTLGKVLDLYQDVVEKIPPIADIVGLLWALPNNGSSIFNLFANAGLQMGKAIVQPYIEAPVKKITDIYNKCMALRAELEKLTKEK